ncbi:glycosyltransferase family 1 protein [Proteiniphilum acetatigenes]|uniref:glycosyltransferase family 1 protein n=1 Tax=Proteiniphilum acetatigenes TaxID=294710 RepID=UPI0008E1F278|nr:glycosyltransferase family 1 protein [Proteiniphilum acetatigenes]SFL32038.1 Glycosyltransferase involved in cell wall bisynthesis [Porphyromonadaceae bacterium KH3CP3RA]
MNNEIPRVLQVFTILNRGGAESMIMNYYRQIDRSKIQFDFLVHREERGVFEDEIEKLGGNIYRMPEINPLNPFFYYKQLNDFFKAHNYKIVHSHINTFSSFPLKVAKLNGIPCRIAHAHTALEPVKLKNIFTPKFEKTEEVKKIIKLLLKKTVSTYATHLFSCGIKAGKWLFNDNEFVVMNNAIDLHLYQYDEDISNELRKKLNLQDVFILGHAGRFSEEKNHFFLLEIFHSIKKKKPNCKLMLLGDGILKNKIGQKAKDLNIIDDIVFLGVRSDVYRLLQMMDVFVFPSFFEGLPVTLVEAQAAGLKVFASNTITREVALTDNIEFLSIKQSPDYWAEKVLAAMPYVRKNNCEIIRAKGYDIIENARRLQNFYLGQINKENNERKNI